MSVNPFDVPAAADLIERLCKLQVEVSERVVGYGSPNDCFCGRGGTWDAYRKGTLDPGEYWMSGGSAVEFIEKATHKAIEEFEQASQQFSKVDQAQRKQFQERWGWEPR